MHVAEFFNALLVRKNIEVVVARLPEGPFLSAQGNRKLQRLDGVVECGSVRLIYEQVDMLRYDNIPGDNKPVLEPALLQGVFEQVLRLRRCEVREAVITTEGEKVHLASLLVSLEPRGHDGEINRPLMPGSVSPSTAPSQVPKCEGPGAPILRHACPAFADNLPAPAYNHPVIEILRASRKPQLRLYGAPKGSRENVN